MQRRVSDVNNLLRGLVYVCNMPYEYAQVQRRRYAGPALPFARGERDALRAPAPPGLGLRRRRAG